MKIVLWKLGDAASGLLPTAAYFERMRDQIRRFTESGSIHNLLTDPFVEVTVIDYEGLNVVVDNFTPDQREEIERAIFDVVREKTRGGEVAGG